MKIIRENHIILSSNNKSIIVDETGICFDLDIKEGYEYRFTGEINYSKLEKDNAALMTFEFDDFILNENNCRDYGLSFSEKVGAYSYLNTIQNTNTFDITVQIPKGVQKLKVFIKPWYNKEEITLGNIIFSQKMNPRKKKIFESCKQIVFSSLEDLKIIYDEPVLYRFIGEELPFEFLAHFKSNSNKLVIIGTAAIKKEIILPAFQRHSQTSQIQESCIIVHDPTLYIHREILVGWYQGGLQYPVISTIHELLEMFLFKMSIETKNVLFYGGSAGGLMMAGYFKDAIACVTNPQTNVLKFNLDIVDKLLKYAFDGLSREEALKKFKKQLSVVQMI